MGLQQRTSELPFHLRLLSVSSQGCVLDFLTSGDVIERVFTLFESQVFDLNDKRPSAYLLCMHGLKKARFLKLDIGTS